MKSLFVVALCQIRLMKQSIKKILTILKWLNDLSEEKSINFSSVLQFALKKELGL